MSGAIPLSPLYPFMAWTVTNLHISPFGNQLNIYFIFIRTLWRTACCSSTVVRCNWAKFGFDSSTSVTESHVICRKCCDYCELSCDFSPMPVDTMPQSMLTSRINTAPNHTTIQGWNCGSRFKSPYNFASVADTMTYRNLCKLTPLDNLTTDTQLRHTNAICWQFTDTLSCAFL